MARKLRHQIEQLNGERWAAKQVLMTSSIDDILTSIQEGTAVAVSDESFKDKFGMACWILENGLETEKIVGLIDVPGYNNEHNA